LKIAAPWSLSHYIPLNGFHPLYRALFDHAPSEISLAAWDNVKLCRHFARDLLDRARVLDLSTSCKEDAMAIEPGTIARSYADHFYPPDRILTETLPGEVEFHHTAPFPSLTRPFVLHCESFVPVFFPCARQGIGRFDRHDELRQHYGRILGSPLCQGIYSHIPETLDGLSTFFSDPTIDAKLFSSRIGLSKLSVDAGMFRPRRPIGLPRFLFVNSAHQMTSNFFNRGGHIVLKFWKEFVTAGRMGTLILRCGRPDDGTLACHGVDPDFVRSELGRSIIWAEGYLSNHEINALMADAHFFLLPSASLHSASILLAMTLGTIPVVTDTLGTSLYVTDREDAIVLKGVRNEIWHLDPDTGVLADHYERMPNVTPSLVTQLVERVFEVLNSPETYLAMSHRSSERARTQFSGEAFASEFWSSVAEKATTPRVGASPSAKSAELSASLQKCALDAAEWARVFESSTQPMRLVYTGTNTVVQLGGTVVHMAGSPTTNLRDWSVFAHYFEPSAPVTTFANSLVDLGDRFLPGRYGDIPFGTSEWKRRASNALMRYPRVHSLASRAYRTMRRSMIFAKLWWQYTQCKSGRVGSESHTELVMEDVHNFNIVHCFHKYYAIPCGEGPFILAKAEGRLYSRTYSAYSLETAVAKVNRGRMSRARRISNFRIVLTNINRMGRHTIRALRSHFSRKQIAPDTKIIEQVKDFED